LNNSSSGSEIELKKYLVLQDQVVREFRRKNTSEMAGIKIEGNNKWMTIIQNASKN